MFKPLDPINILIVSGNFDHILDGVAITLQKWARFLSDRGHNVAILSPKNCGEMVGQYQRIEVLSIPLPFRSEYRLAFHVPLSSRRKVKQFKPDIIHIATPDHTGNWALKWSKKHHIPVISSFHTHFTSYLRYYHLQCLENWSIRFLDHFYNQCDRVYVTSQLALKYVKGIKASEKIKIWGRGVDRHQFHPKYRSEAWRSRFQRDPNSSVILWVSRLVAEKNVAIFEQSVQRAMSDNPNLTPIIVGEGPLRKKMMRRHPQWHFLGTLTGNELSTAYASADMFVFPSISETFGNVVLEALSSGCPVIASDYPVNRHLVTHNQNGVLCDPNSSQAFTEAILKLADQTEMRSDLSKSGEQTASHYDQMTIHHQFLTSILELIKEKKR